MSSNDLPEQVPCVLLDCGFMALVPFKPLSQAEIDKMEPGQRIFSPYDRIEALGGHVVYATIAEQR